jgi:hypothetical protein
MTTPKTSDNYKAIYLTSTKYRAWPSAPHSAVTGPVEIHAFSEWTLATDILSPYYKGLAVTSRDDVIDGRPPHWRYFFSRRADVLIENNVRKRPKIGHLSGPDSNVPMQLIKLGLRHQDLEGIHLPSFRFLGN